MFFLSVFKSKPKFYLYQCKEAELICKSNFLESRKQFRKLFLLIFISHRNPKFTPLGVEILKISILASVLV